MGGLLLPRVLEVPRSAGVCGLGSTVVGRCRMHARCHSTAPSAAQHPSGAHCQPSFPPPFPLLQVYSAIVSTFTLKTRDPPSKWVLASTALLLQDELA